MKDHLCGPRARPIPVHTPLSHSAGLAPYSSISAPKRRSSERHQEPGIFELKTVLYPIKYITLYFMN